MGAVWMRLRAELRGRRRGILAMALLVGIAGAAVLASFAGARRTASAYPRFIDAQDQFDVLVDPESQGPKANARAFAKVRALDRLEDSSIVNLAEDTVVRVRGLEFGFPDIFVIWTDNGRFLRTFHRMKIVEGRRADPDDPAEAEMPFTVADRFGLQADDVITIRFGADSGRPEGIEADVRVVGIGATPGSFEPSSGSYFPFVSVSPRLIERIGAAAGDDPVMMADVAGDTAGIAAFRADVAALGPAVLTEVTLEPQTEAVARSSRFQVVALQLLGLLTALAAVAVLGQALVRATIVGSGDAEILAALGMGRVQVFTLGIVRSLIVGVVGAAVTVCGALLLSPLTPIGPMRLAEPDPGVAADWLVVGFGAIAVVLVVVATAVSPAWRVSSAVRRLRMREAGAAGGVRASGALARSGASPAAVAGVRAAFDRGGGADTVPIRTTIAGASLSIAALVAALVFAASLAHLVATPRLAGWGWDALVGAGGPLDRFVARTQSVDVVETVATGGAAGLDIGGVLMFGFVFDAGDVEPSIAAGVAPSRSDEIALGPATMRRLRVGIGDTVPITFGNQETGETGAKDVPLRVVGRSVTPNFFFSTQAPGEGAVVSPEAARRYIPDYTTDFLYVRFRPEVSVDDGIQRLNAALGQTFLIPRRQSS